jgi:hypothetical protein
MKSEYLLYLEWLVANRQNRIEWVIVIAEDWKTFGKSTERQKRLKEINDLSHEFSISTGGDIPICMIQQHAMYMTDGM